MKEKSQYIAAILALIAGIVLCYIAYFLERDIVSSVLYFFAQCVIYSASVFGVSLVISDIRERKNEKNK